MGENTVESFIAAASLGAAYVEFDVQLTKDYVPVVYHDFTVAESGVDIPMHSLTLEQFMGLNKTVQRPTTTVDDEVLVRNKPRAKSHYNLGSNLKENRDFDNIEKELENAHHERMKLTKTWKVKVTKVMQEEHLLHRILSRLKNYSVKFLQMSVLISKSSILCWMKLNLKIWVKLPLILISMLILY